MAFGALLAVLVLIHNTGGLLGAEVRSSIIGGQNAQRNGWPWMAHLNISDGVNRWRCGGTIVARQWVLTAASCWDTNPQPNLAKSMIWVGSHELQKASADYMGVSFFMKHPDYQALSGGGYANDLALVKLKKPVKLSFQVKTVKLPRGDETFGSTSECWITGWGYTGINTPLPNPEILQQLKVSIIPHSDCKAKTPELTADMLCAGDMAGKKGACKGDYGGPLVCHTAAGYVQVGIMSYGDCGLPDHPGVYTNVSNYVSYINDYIKNGEEASA